MTAAGKGPQVEESFVLSRTGGRSSVSGLALRKESRGLTCYQRGRQRPDQAGTRGHGTDVSAVGSHQRVLSKGRVDLHAKMPPWGALWKMN